MDRDAVNSAPRDGNSYRVAGAREVYQLLTNPECATLSALLCSGHTPAEAAAALSGGPVRDEGSPVAFAVGRQFEGALKRDGSARIRQMYHDRGRWPDASAVRILDLLEVAPGDTSAARGDRLHLTRDWLARRADGDRDAPDLLWHGRMEVALDHLHVTLEPDLLTAGLDVPLCRPGEVKALQERGPRTPQAALANARIQSALAVIGTRQLVGSLGLGDAEERVPAIADLIIRRGQSMMPMLRTVRLRWEIEQLTSVPILLAAQVGLTLALLPPGAPLVSSASLEALPIRYRESCAVHCALNAHCEARARTAGDPAVLGEAMVEALEGVSLHRIRVLLAGEAGPATDAERRVMVELRDADTLLGLTAGGYRRAG